MKKYVMKKQSLWSSVRNNDISSLKVKWIILVLLIWFLICWICLIGWSSLIGWIFWHKSIVVLSVFGDLLFQCQLFLFWMVYCNWFIACNNFHSASLLFVPLDKRRAVGKEVGCLFYLFDGLFQVYSMGDLKHLTLSQPFSNNCNSTNTGLRLLTTGIK